MQQSQQDPQARIRLLEAELERARQEAQPVRKFVGFAEALAGLREGSKFKRQDWEGAIAAQVPDSGSKMTAPYLYFDDGKVRVPYVVSNDDLFSTDWILVEAGDPGHVVLRRQDGSWDVDSAEPWFVRRFKVKNQRDPSQAEIVQFLQHVKTHCEEQAARNPSIKDFRILF